MNLLVDLPLGGPGAGLAALAGVLVVLALIDSTSFGTLLIPVWLLLAPGRLRAGRVLAYLATVAAAYLGVGVVVLLGAGAFLDRFGDVLETRPVLIGQLVLGIGLFALSFRVDGKRARARQAGSGRLSRWRERALGAAPAGGAGGAGGGAPRVQTRTSILPLLGLALTAVALEVATMLPYLAAIGLVTSSGIGWPGSAAVLAAYCVVMVLPALVLLAARLLAARLVDPFLHRLDRWLTRNAAGMTGWVLGIVGVLLTLDAFGRLGWTG
ncbi:GAP family protein [Oerskovia flava]|uniref:GAP family protein n=1 Tax=Oerskovia flava TaxID=2986422 RepID=UPI00223F8DFD|nr:GAP family protein [Oerskovia sp. JB1-3-2]